MQMRRFGLGRAACAAGICLVLVAVASADWDAGDPHKMDDVFLPDLSAVGMDVNASWTPAGGGEGRYILFDDFLCAQAGPITDIHLWGSWLDDAYPDNDPGNVTFIVSLHNSITGDQESWPDLSNAWVRTFCPGTFTVRPYATDLEEGWMDPDGTYIPGADTVCWQYNFQIDESEAFWQDYDERYWLNVTAIPTVATTWWGWKTTAVDAEGKGNWARWTYEMSPWDSQHDPGEQQQYLVYPNGHPNGPNPPDHWWTADGVGFAFVITPEPGTLTLLALGALAVRRRRRMA